MTWAFVLTAAIPTIAVLIGIMMNNGRFNDLSKRMDDLNAAMHSRPLKPSPSRKAES